MGKHGHLLLFIALIWTKSLKVASINIIPPLNDVRDCSKPADAGISFGASISIAQQARFISEGISKLVGPLEPLGDLLGNLGLGLNIVQFIMNNLVPAEDEMSALATCITNQIQQKMNQHGYEDLTNIVDGFKSNFERNVMRDLERHSVIKENCVEVAGGDTRQKLEFLHGHLDLGALGVEENCKHIDFESMSYDEQLEIWRDLEQVVNSMDVLAAKFKGSKHDYSAGYYYALPYFASKHFLAMVLQIDLSSKLQKINKSSQTTYLKQDFGGFIKYYSEICLRFWRIARDNFCQNQDWNIECISQPAPFHLFLEEWAKLAETFDQPQVKDYIMQALSRNKIKVGEWVALKSAKKAKEHWASERSVTSKENFVWFSCTSKRSYCYLRDCPGKYFIGSGCHGEKFKIHTGSSDGNAYVKSRDKVGIRSYNGNWLSMYTPDYCRCTTYTGNCYYTGHPWWTTRSCPGDGSNWPAQSGGCEDEVHYIYHVNDIIRYYRHRHSKELMWSPDWNDGPASILENGDFVYIEWRGNCESQRDTGGSQNRCCDNSSKNNALVFGGPFEIVKVDYGTGAITETNNWDTVPRLPGRENK